MDAREQRDLVRRGYDAVSHAYRNDEGLSADGGESPQAGFVEELAGLLPAGARVLDLGCGNGLPATKLLVEKGFEVVGLDFSTVQVERARALVPGATFIEADMAAWDAEPASFDAVVTFYALIHVPLEDQRALFPRLRRWLRPGGLLLAIVGAERWTGVEGYLGAPMFWDHEDAGAYVRWLTEAGFKVAWTRFVPEGSSGHTLLLARAV